MMMDYEKKFVLNQLKRLEEIKNLKSWVSPNIFVKNSDKSVQIRKQGNKLFTQKNHTSKIHEQIWKCYCRSIATAHNSSEELAAGYANRSALLIHLKKYEDCNVDIERALKITTSDSLKVKLYCRQVECFVALRSGKIIVNNGKILVNNNLRVFFM